MKNLIAVCMLMFTIAIGANAQTTTVTFAQLPLTAASDSSAVTADYKMMIIKQNADPAVPHEVHGTIMSGANPLSAAQSVPVVPALPVVKKTTYVDLADRLGLGFGGGDLRVLVSYDIFKVNIKVFGLNEVVSAGAFVGQNDVRWNRVDFAPQINVSYGKTFVGVLYRPQENRAGLMFGYKY